MIAEATSALAENDADYEELRGTLAGKVVLGAAMPTIEAKWEAPARRFTAADLEERAMAAEPRSGGNSDPSRFRAARERQERLRDFLREEGVVAVLEPSARGTGGTIFVSGGGSRVIGDDYGVPQIVLTAEHYGRIYRTLEKGVAVKMEIDVRSTFHEEDPTAFNVLAELPGTDLADEIVMLGAHFDSWHAGTGATDNAAGAAAMMEAVRIIKQAGLQPRRGPSAWGCGRERSGVSWAPGLM